MKTSSAGIDFIIAHEGERLEIYQDSAGYDTIGVGHLIQQYEDYSGGISPAQSRELLQKDLERTEFLINNKITASLTQSQFDALVSLVFNIPSSISTGSIDDRINNREPLENIGAVWLSYNKARVNGVLTVLPGLDTRRKDEWAMYSDNLYAVKKKSRKSSRS
jgi:lysozyme